MKSEDMRSLYIDSSLDDLKQLNNWNYEERKIGGMKHNVLYNTSKNIEIIIEERNNQLHTSNILTQDSLDIAPKLKDDQIMQLAESLDKADIGYSINVSTNDLKNLLSK